MIPHKVIGAALSLVCCLAQAQVWPQQPLRIIVPFAAGTNNDTVARTLAPALTQRLAQLVVVDNRSGADGQLGADLAARSSPNGQTLLLISVSHAIGHSVYSTRQHNLLRDFASIGQIGSVSYFVAVNPKLSMTTLADLVQAARAQPGQVTIGSSGAGTGLWVDLFSYITKITVIKVPYSSQTQVAAAAVSGDIVAGVLSSQAALTQIVSGRLRGLAVTGSTRSVSLNTVPTVSESGWPMLSASSWYGLVVPQATGVDTVAQLNHALNQALAMTAVQQRLAVMEVEIKAGSPSQFGQFVASEVNRWAQIVALASQPQLP
jgi:tripartite-type tricarboxylate transporter receptor subunit TctC